MYKVCSGTKDDSDYISMHLAFCQAIRKYKINNRERTFGRKGNLTNKQFYKNCQRAEELYKRSRW